MQVQICNEDLSTALTRTYGEKALKMFLVASGKRKDQKHLYVQKLLNVKLQNKCYILYTSDKNIKNFLAVTFEVNSSNRQYFKDAREFNYDKLCLICGAQSKKRVAKMSTISNIQTIYSLC